MSNQLLLPFNTFTFAQATQILLSNMTLQDLKTFLMALQGSEAHSQLKHSVRTRIIVTALHQFDRSIYYFHYDRIASHELISERCNLVASKCGVQQMEEIFKNYVTIQQKMLQLQNQDRQMLQQAISNPPLALPPIRRDTIAPQCQTVYQLTLACPQENTQNICQIDCQFVFQTLQTQIELVDSYLNALQDPLQHFMELVLRFNVYRDTVLAIHQNQKFQCIVQTMQLWKNKLYYHYQKANQTYCLLMNPQNQQICQMLVPEQIQQQGYMADYVDSLVDLSVNQQSVAYCGHSKQNLSQFYACFESLVLEQLEQELKSMGELGQCVLMQKYEQWQKIGIKPCTISKISDKYDAGEQYRQKKNQQDAIISRCARIHGFRPLEGLQCPLL